jgi:predicted permease
MASRIRLFFQSFRKSEFDSRMNDELQSHLAARTAELERTGISRKESERRARVEFGGMQKYSEQMRESRGFSQWLETFFQDLRFGLRMLRKNPGFAAVAILTLALGIGANTAIFSIVDAVLLRPLQFPEPQQLVRVIDNAPGAGLHNIGMSQPELRDLQERSGVFQDISAVWPVDANVTGAGHPERIELLVTSPNYFSLLGARPQIGRVLGSEDVALSFAEAVVISDGLWRREFGGDPRVLGTRIRLDGDAYTIVGVMPAGFRHPGETLATDVDVWGTAGFVGDPFPATPLRSTNFLPGAIARIRPGISLAEAQQRLDSFAAQLRAEYPADYRPEGHFSIQLEPLKETIVGNVRPMLLTLLGAVGMMLLIGCVNIANLLLARAAGRQREFAIRQSLGAARGRLIRQLLTESVLLAVAAGIVGVACAAWGLRLLLYLVPSKVPRVEEIGVDARVLIFAFAICVITGVLFGLVPALQSSGFQIAGSLKESARGSGGRKQSRTSSALVTAEFAICLILMTGAGGLIHSFWKLSQTNPGFNPQNTLVARIWLATPNDPKQDQYAKVDDRSVLVRDVLRRVSALPGVTGAAMSTSVPLSARGTANPVTIEGRQASAGDATLAEPISVSPDYFSVLGTPLVQGREFVESDQTGTDRVAIVDRSTAAKFWPGDSAIGKRVHLGRTQSKNPWATIVGVVGDIRHDGVDNDGVPHIYFSIYQAGSKVMAVVVRSPGDPQRLGEAIRSEIQTVDPKLPVFGISTFGSILATSLAPRRFSAELMGTFAVLALLLAAIGIYGVLAYFVGQRTREIGIRMALGAAAGAVARMVLWQGMRPIALGMAIGVMGSLMFSRLLAGMMYGVKVADPLVLFVVPLALLLAAFLASYVPARRATLVDPIVALRDE